MTSLRAWAFVAHYEDIVGRYHGRPASRQEILDAQAGYASDDLTKPLGILLLAGQGPTRRPAWHQHS